MNYYNISQIFNKLFVLNNYLYSMTIYHLVAIYYFFMNITGFKLQTLVNINQHLIHSGVGLADVIICHEKIGAVLVLSGILVFIDLIFLLILSYDFKSLNLTMNRIMYLEVMIFALSLTFPVFRGTMLFLSLNTLQIFIFYHIAKWFSNVYYFEIPRYIIVSGGYILLIKIIFYPLF